MTLAGGTYLHGIMGTTGPKIGIIGIRLITCLLCKFGIQKLNLISITIKMKSKDTSKYFQATLF
jgi:hypothetical protein